MIKGHTMILHAHIIIKGPAANHSLQEVNNSSKSASQTYNILPLRQLSAS